MSIFFCNFASVFGKWCSQMSRGDIKRTIASTLPTATYGYVGDPNKRGKWR